MATASDVIYTSAGVEGRSSSCSECSSPSSVSDLEDYSRMNGGSRRRSGWRKLMKKVVEGSRKSIYGSPKPLVFRYDAVSYSLNFDDGNHSDEHYSYGSRCSRF